jgi:hypothetical protein
MFYMMQTILFIPGLILFNISIVWILWELGCRLWYGPDQKWSDFKYVLIGLIVFEVQITMYETFFTHLRNMFPYVKPHKFPKLIWKGLKWLGAKLKAPFNRARNGLTYYIQIAYNYLKMFCSAIYEAIAKGVKAIASFLYTITKGILEALWEGLKFLFDLIVIKILGSIASAYFGIFRLVLRGLKNLGIFGELLFIPFGLAWLLWPLGVSYYVQKQYGFPEVWIGGVIIAVVFIVRGRQIIIEE